jgi:hypothetical protein
LETQRTKQGNLLAADKMMREKFGEKAVDVFNNMASTPALKNIYMELAAVDPNKFVSLFGGEGSNATQVDAGGSVNTTVNLSDTTSVRAKQPGTKEFYDNVRKTNPSLYYSQEFQLNMDKVVRTNPNLYYGKK